MGFDKLVAPLAGRPLLSHSLAAFESCSVVDAVALVCHPGRVGEFETLAADFSKVRWIVPGGKERRDSVRCGLSVLDPLGPAYVAIHDGARPLVTPDVISQCHQLACQSGAASCAEPETDTIYRADDALCPQELIPRENVWRMQTPQIFGFAALSDLLRADHLDRTAQTDEVSAWIRSGATLRILETPDWNLKVTHPRDLAVAESILRARVPLS